MRNFTSRLYNEEGYEEKVGAGGKFEIFLDSVVCLVLLFLYDTCVVC